MTMKPDKQESGEQINIHDHEIIPVIFKNKNTVKVIKHNEIKLKLINFIIQFLKYNNFYRWSFRPESNLHNTDYKSAALPVELRKHGGGDVGYRRQMIRGKMMSV